jgi:hypothetical protein
MDGLENSVTSRMCIFSQNLCYNRGIIVLLADYGLDF